MAYSSTRAADEECPRGPLGIWFVIMGIFEIIGALILRDELKTTVLSLT
jgi:hypothetical protein